MSDQALTAGGVVRVGSSVRVPVDSLRPWIAGQTDDTARAAVEARQVCALEALSDNYLTWLLDLELREAPLSPVCAGATRRATRATQRPATGAPDRYAAEELVSAGRQALAKRHHPDAGGTHANMVVVNSTADWLIDRLREQLAS